MKKYSPIFILFIVICAGCAENKKTTAPVELRINGLSTEKYEQVRTELLKTNLSVYNQGEVPIRDFQLKNLKGQPVKLSDQKGKVVLLNFWATWCGPCRSEMPSMEKLYQKYRSSGFEILAVDLQEAAETVSEFAKEQGYSFPILLDTTGEQAQAYGARGIPTSYLIDKQGYIVAGIVGATEWFTPSVEKAMGLLLE
ncbi:MAG: TlpA family protein disulfide reductase [Spirochaetales bacterium]|nr:TlpA family protein disulfide reductase [Spirochaetales bacterium]